MTHNHSHQPQGPFKESDAYLDQLINRCTENAIRTPRQQRRRRPQVIALALTAAASLVLLVAVGTGWLHTDNADTLPVAMEQSTTTGMKQAHDTAEALRAVAHRPPTVLAEARPASTTDALRPATATTQPEQSSPLDEFLEGISDEEAEVLAYSTMEDIPEY